MNSLIPVNGYRGGLNVVGWLLINSKVFDHTGSKNLNIADLPVLEV